MPNNIMSRETAKKRKRDGRAGEEGGGGGAIMEKMMAEVKAQMESRLDAMQGRLSSMDELERRCQSLESSLSDTRVECQFLKARCESLERSVQILTKDTKWEYAAPSIPNSHWIARGFDENYIEGMEVFLKRIKKYTCALRRGACGEDIGLGGFDEGDDTVLLHDDALLPHWKEFANALQLYQNPEAFHRLSIYNMQLSSSVIGLLTPALKDKPIKAFYLDRNGFVNPREGIEFAIEIIQSNQKLKQFGWANNPIENMADANHLVEVIISHPLIKSIRLENCFGGNVDAYKVLCSLLASNKTFATIIFNSNNLRTSGGTEIPSFLATNPSLVHLFLANNHLDDNDAVMIAHALKRNTNLRRLRLGQNDITDIGHDALRHVDVFFEEA